MIGIRSAISIRARGHRPHLEAVYMTAPRSACRNAKKLVPRGGRPYMTRLRDLAARCARVVREAFAQENEGVGNAGCSMHPRPRVRMVSEAHERSHHRSTGTPGIPARNGFNGLFRALPGRRIRLVTVIRGLRFCLKPGRAD